MAEGDKYEGDIYVRDGMTVRDGKGAMARVGGTQRTDRDLYTEVNWWQLRPKREGSIALIPLDKNGRKMEWCSYPYHEGEDETGKDDKGWRPRDDFSTYTDRHGKKRLREHCDKCRAKHERRMYALQREAEGKPVRSWNRRHAG